MIPTSTDWLMGEKKAPNGDFVYFRFVAAKPEQSSRLPEVISITWRFTEAYPNDALRASMDALENALSGLSFAEWSRLALVMTFRGAREWCFYVNDYRRFMAEVHSVLSSGPGYPVEIEHNYDPQWSYWHTFVDRKQLEPTEPNQALQTTPVTRSVDEKTIESGRPQRGV